VAHLFLALTLLAGQAQHRVPDQPVNAQAQALVDFTARVDQYVRLRKMVDDAAPPLKPTEDAGKIREAQLALAERIRQARSSARHGDIFTPEISAVFRRLLRPEVKDQGTKEAIVDDNPGGIPFKVNGAYPDKEPLSTVPPNVLDSLPKLPEKQHLEYRFVGKHLILRDSSANLIVDYVPNALP
jgi:hypothetical protein